MRKFGMRSGEMSSSSSYVDDATGWARDLTQTESRCPGDYGNAMRRLARQINIPFRVLWNLHYRRPKTIDAAVFVSLGAAYEQRKLYREERDGYAPKTRLGRLLVRAIDTALDENVGTVDR